MSDKTTGPLLLLLSAVIVLSIALGVFAPDAYPEGDTAMIRTGLAVVAALWTVSIGLLLWTRQRSLAFGVAFSASGLFLLGAIPLALIEFAIDSWTSTFRSLALLQGGLAVLAGLWAAHGARREPKPFVAGIATALLLILVLGPSASAIFEGRLETVQKSRDTQRTNETRATSRVFALTSCLLRRHADTGGQAFPRSLHDLGGDAGCGDSRDALPGYQLTYTTSADASHFQIIAEPEGARGQAGVVVADARGLVFLIRPHPGANKDGSLGAYLHWKERGLSSIYGMQRMIGEIMDAERLTAPPSTLASSMADPSTRAGRWLNETLADGNAYKVEYVHAPDGDAGTYGVRSTCQRYGDACIRSYYRGPDGLIHGTGLPRAATANDPVIDPREDDNGDVSGLVGWGGR